MKCPKCKFVVSDKKVSCPKCGFVLKPGREASPSKNEGNKVAPATSAGNIDAKSAATEKKGGFLKSLLGKTSEEEIKDSETPVSPAEAVVEKPVEAPSISETLSSKNSDLQNLVTRAETGENPPAETSSPSGSILDQEIDDFEMFIQSVEAEDEVQETAEESSIEEITETSISGIISQVEESAQKPLENLNLHEETEDKIKILEDELTADSYLVTEALTVSAPEEDASLHTTEEKQLENSLEEPQFNQQLDSSVSEPGGTLQSEAPESTLAKANHSLDSDMDWRTESDAAIPPQEVAEKPSFDSDQKDPEPWKLDLDSPSEGIQKSSSELTGQLEETATDPSIPNPEPVEEKNPFAQDLSSLDLDQGNPVSVQEQDTALDSSNEERLPDPQIHEQAVETRSPEQETLSGVEQASSSEVDSKTDLGLSDELLAEVGGELSEELTASPFVAPKVMEFGDGAEGWEDQLDQLLGDESLNVESVAVEKSEEFAQPDFDNSFLIGDDMEVSIEFEVEGEEEEYEDEDDVEDQVVESSAPAEAPAKGKGENLLSGLVSAFEQIGAAPQRQSLTAKEETEEVEPVSELEVELEVAQNIVSNTVSNTPTEPVSQDVASQLEAKDKLIFQLSTLLAEAYGVSPQDLLEDDPLVSLGQTLEDELAELMSMGNSFVQAEEDQAPTEEVPGGSGKLANLQAELDGELEALVAEGMNVIDVTSIENVENNDVDINQELAALAQLTDEISKEESPRTENEKFDIELGETGAFLKSDLEKAIGNETPKDELAAELEALETLEREMDSSNEELPEALTETGAFLKEDITKILEETPPLNNPQDNVSEGNISLEDGQAASSLSEEMPEPLKESVGELTETNAFLKSDIDKILEQTPVFEGSESESPIDSSAAPVDQESSVSDLSEVADQMTATAASLKEEIGDILENTSDDSDTNLGNRLEETGSREYQDPSLEKTFDNLFNPNNPDLQQTEVNDQLGESHPNEESNEDQQSLNTADPQLEDDSGQQWDLSPESTFDNTESEYDLNSPESNPVATGAVEMHPEERLEPAGEEAFLMGAELEQLISETSHPEEQQEPSQAEGESLLGSASLGELISEAAIEDNPQSWAEETEVDETPQPASSGTSDGVWDFSEAGADQATSIADSLPMVDVAIDDANLANLLEEAVQEESEEEESTEEEDLSEKKSPKIILR